jgi:CheY-like chemotaxis protein
MSQQNSSLWFVIDDDLDDQEIFSIAANKVDPAIECTFANDGVHALERITQDASFSPTCIFLDVNMPRMNGVECLEALRTMDRLNDVPIFICSTSSDPKIIAKVKELGAHDFIVKPATIAEFAAVLTAVNQDLQA